MNNMELIKEHSVPLCSDEYYKMSEDRKVITPENIGGLVEYPALFHAMQDDRELRPALSEAMTTGRACADFLAMTSEEFAQAYTIAAGPVNPKTGKPYGTDSKAYLEWKAMQPKPTVSPDDFNLFGKYAAAYNGHAFVKSLTDAGMGLMHNVIIKTNVSGVDVLCKIDKIYVSDKAVMAVDVKTTSDLCTFEAAADRLHYRIQQGLIAYALRSIGVDPQVRIAAIEKGPMPRCGIFGIHDIASHESAVAILIAQYAEMCKSGQFITGFEAPRAI